jgi:hypothetical protein
MLNIVYGSEAQIVLGERLSGQYEMLFESQ